MLNWSYYQIRFIYDSEPNGCFVNGDVGTRPKTFAAYERVGVTRWIRSAKDHKVRFGMLWSGVDTHYYVAIEGELAGVLRGKGYPSAYPDGRDLKAEHFFARRIGDADPQICISAARARNEG